MDTKVFATPHTEQLHNNGDISGLKLKLKNEKTKVLRALLEGMKRMTAGQVGQRIKTPAVTWAIACLYSDARVADPRLPHIDNPFLAADAYLQVHQDARVDAMLEPDNKKPARVKRSISFDDIDFVQHFDKHEAPAALDKSDSGIQQSGLMKPRPRRARSAPVAMPTERVAMDESPHTVVLTQRFKP